MGPVFGGANLLAFGFGSLAMLGWLAAAAAPIVIHLWNKRKYREIHWAAMEYLLAAMRKNSRRIQVEQWILLAVRTALVALVALAAAQPFLERFGLDFVAGQRTLKLLVIDGSYSMAFKPSEKSRFERAKQLASQIVGESHQGDAFTLVLMSTPPAVIVGTPAVEPRAFLDEIENLKPAHGGADLVATLAKVDEVLGKADQSSFPRREVYFLSDLQRVTWMPDAPSDFASRRPAQAAADASPPTDVAAQLGANQVGKNQGGAEPANPAEPPAAGGFRDLVDRLGRVANLIVIDVGQQGGSENLAITGLRTSEPFVTTGDDVSLEGQVRNFGTQPQNHRLVECYVDGRRVRETYVDVPAGEQVPWPSGIGSTPPPTMVSNSVWPPICSMSTTIAGSRKR